MSVPPSTKRTHNELKRTGKRYAMNSATAGCFMCKRMKQRAKKTQCTRPFSTQLPVSAFSVCRSRFHELVPPLVGKTNPATVLYPCFFHILSPSFPFSFSPPLVRGVVSLPTITGMVAEMPLMPWCSWRWSYHCSHCLYPCQDKDLSLLCGLLLCLEPAPGKPRYSLAAYMRPIVTYDSSKNSHISQLWKADTLTSSSRRNVLATSVQPKSSAAAFSRNC